MQSSPWAIARCDLRKSFHQPTRCSWTKAPTPPGCQQGGGTIEDHVCTTQCEPNWDLSHLAWGKSLRSKNSKGPFRSLSHNNHVRMAFPSSKIATSRDLNESGSTWLYQPMIGCHVLHVVRPSHHQLWALNGVHSTKIHNVRWNKWSIWSYHALQAIHDPWRREWCTAVQSLSS